MKVILLAPIPNHIASGGIGSWTGRILENSPIGKYEIGVVSENHIGKRETYGENSKRNFFVEAKRCCRIWSNLNKNLKDKDVVLVQSCIPAAFLSMLREYICALITKSHKKKFVVHFHCTVPDFASGKKEKWMLIKLSKIADAFVVLNKASKVYLDSMCETTSVIIPNFTGKDEISDVEYSNRYLKKIIYTGGITIDKGCIDLFEVAKQVPDIDFYLYGEASHDVQIIANDIKNVHLCGVVSHKEIKNHLQDSDVYISLSHSEGFSMSILEAMAAGLPIVATNVGANFDMIENKGGIIVDAYDVHAVCYAIESIRDFDIRLKMSQSNVEKVRKCYIDSCVLPQFESLYDSLIK